MPASLPPEIRADRLRQTIRYELPPRQLGAARLAGLIPIIVGLVFVGLALFWLVQVLRGTVQGGEVIWTNLLMGLVALPFIFAGLVPLRLGALMLWGRVRIELDESHLRVIEYAGLFRKKRQCQRGLIRQFNVVMPGAVPTPQALQPLAALGTLRAELEPPKSFSVAVAYPKDWLRALGEDLSEHLALPATAAVRIEQATRALEPEPDAPPLFEQPRDSMIRVQSEGVATIFTVPPPGVWRGARGLMVGSLIWGVILVPFTIAYFAVGFPLPLLLFLLLFWGVWVGLALGAVNVGTTRALFVAGPVGLKLARQNLFGKKAQAWSLGELQTITAGPSGTRVNNRPLYQLQIRLQSGRKLGLLTGRAEEELRWLATQLRTALKLAEPAPEPRE